METNSIPPGWQLTTLGTIAKKEYGLVDGPFGSNLPASDYVPIGVPVIRGSNLSLGEVSFKGDEFVYVSEETAKRLERSLCEPEDIVFTKKGTLGQTGFVPTTHRYKKFLISSNQMKLSVDRKVADPRFVYYYVSSPTSREKIIRDSEVTGVPKTNLAYLRTFPILLPPLDEQKAIAHILGTLDDKIELNQQMNRTLERIQWTLFNSWFSKSVFPDDWQLLPLEACMEAIIDYRGRTPRKTNSGIPLITAKIIKNGRIRQPQEFIALEDYDDWMRRGIPKAGDIVMTTEAPLGEVAKLNGKKVALAQRLITLRSKPGLLDNIYLKFLMRTSFVQEQLHAKASGSTVLGIKQSELRQVTFPIPPFDKQEHFMKPIKCLEHKIDSSEEESLTLESIRVVLLPKLLSGEISVPVARQLIETI